MVLKNETSSPGVTTRCRPNFDPKIAGIVDKNPLKISISGAAAASPANKRSDSASTSAPRTKEAKPSAPSPSELSDTGSEEIDLNTTEGDDWSWISWFCSLQGNDLLCEVDEDFIMDDFNLFGLQAQVPCYDYALDMILDNDSLSVDVDDEEHSDVESAAKLLYGLIHARYILTSKGLNAMHEKYRRMDFGICPRVLCEGQPCLPMGTSDAPRNGLVKIYCPKCEDLYFPRCKYQCNMDGAYFGTTFPHLYLMTYPSANSARQVQSYIPRVFGFKFHRSSR